MLTMVILEDQHLFWKGSGAAFKPILQEDGTVKRFVITSKGQNYSDLVYAKVSGAGADLFKLGKPIYIQRQHRFTSLEENILLAYGACCIR